MKKIILFTFTGLLLCSFFMFGFSPKKATINANEIQWYTFEEAIEKNKKMGKPIFIDVYTDWCKWCTVMDQKTFSNSEVIRHMNENYYAVKFDAEQTQPITFKGKKYEFIPSGRKGIHGLAYDLLDRNASYPSFIVLDEKLNRQGIIKGYKTPQKFLETLNQISTTTAAME